jgi:methylthioribose-1-phosphate isomerase
MNTVERAKSITPATLRWSNDALELLDQRMLPLEVAYIRCSSAEGVARAIREMVVRGAPAIGVAAAYGIALEALRLASSAPEEQSQKLRAAFDTLRAARPTAVNLAWALERQLDVLTRVGAAATGLIAKALLDEAHRILAEDIAINLAIGAYGAELIPDRASVLTHCNAGALATAGHGTALGVIRSAVATGKQLSVFADETRPLLQGARLTAWELMQDGIDVTVITDSSAGWLLSRGEIDLIVVGADRVAGNGDTANKIGTYPLAVLAQRHGVPFYVACPLSTIDSRTKHGDDIPIEERAGDEVTGLGQQRKAPAGVAVRNPAFDVTPASLITALITERGVVQRPDRVGIARLLSGEVP